MGIFNTKARNLTQRVLFFSRGEGRYPAGQHVGTGIRSIRELSIVLQWSNQDRMHHTPGMLGYSASP